MAKYLDDDFLLGSDAARELYHGYAEKMPIIDYHCHLPPKEIAGDKRWNDIAEVWLGGDHYKWRQMRSNGADERLCTGDATGREKFRAFAAAMEKLVGNPLFDWSHLELKRYFGIEERLSAATADAIFDRANEVVKTDGFSARGLMKRSNVKAVCTTDDPDDTLEFHEQIAKDFPEVKVLPTWRPDRLIKQALADGSDPIPHLAERHVHFEKHGCVLSDYGITAIPEGRAADILVESIKLDAKAGWTVQLHFNCIRNPNTTMFNQLGPDTGFDFIGEPGGAGRLAKIFDRLACEDLLPQTIVYSLNPCDNAALGSLIGSFQKGPSVGRLQLGAAWWFNDHKKGMTQQLEDLMALGCLGNFVGMLTDSRSFLSYTRHEYFRRILCGILGGMVERGELPDDREWLGKLVADVSYNNANRYFFGNK